MGFAKLSEEDRAAILMFTVEIEQEFPVIKDPKELYPKLSRKFLQRFSETKSLPGGFAYWEKMEEEPKFCDDILKYWTIETIIHAVVDMVEDSTVRARKDDKGNFSLGESQKLKIGYADIVAKWAIWAENDPNIKDVKDLDRMMKNRKNESGRFHEIYGAIEEGAIIMKKNRNKDLKNNVNFDKRSSKVRSGDLTIGFYNEIDYMINFFFRSMWKVSLKQEKDKRLFGKIWRKETARVKCCSQKGFL